MGDVNLPDVWKRTSGFLFGRTANHRRGRLQSHGAHMKNNLLLGQQVGKKLIDGLGLPKNTVSFVLRCAVDEIVTVRCEYFPEGGEAFDTLINDYQLIAVGGTIRLKPAFNFDAWLKDQNDAAHAAMLARHADLSRMDAKLICNK